MLTSNCIDEYRNFFDTTLCAFCEPSDKIMVFCEETHTWYISPTNETDEMFKDRINRCKEEKRNLFFEEWEIFNPNVDVIY
ncbi:MAG: hypothetical protein J6A37_01150 [Oscillospiraceae bacterium]|nr:hypothetical protein [Oscillospiraceae bacterium]